MAVKAALLGGQVAKINEIVRRDPRVELDGTLLIEKVCNPFMVKRIRGKRIRGRKAWIDWQSVIFSAMDWKRVQYDHGILVRLIGDRQIPLSTFRELVRRGVSIRGKDARGRDLVMLSKSEAMLRIFLEAGLAADHTLDDGRSALILHAVDRSPSYLKLLIQHGADVTRVDKHGESCLDKVIRRPGKKWKTRFKLFLGHGCKVSVVSVNLLCDLNRQGMLVHLLSGGHIDIPSSWRGIAVRFKDTKVERQLFRNAEARKLLKKEDALYYRQLMGKVLKKRWVVMRSDELRRYEVMCSHPYFDPALLRHVCRFL